MNEVKVKVRLTCNKTFQRKDGSLSVNMIVKQNDPMNAAIPAGNLILQIPKDNKEQGAFIEGSDYLVELALIQGE